MAHQETILRRKLATPPAADQPPTDSGARCWKTAFARATRERAGLDVDTRALRDERLSLAELLELLPNQPLLAVLEGPEMSLGLLVMSQGVTAAIIEAQTMGRLNPAPAPARRPTRTDAAMCATLIDQALATMEVSLASSGDLTWAGGFRYASFLEEPRALALLLDDLPYRALITELGIDGGQRDGEMMLVLPAEGRGPVPLARPLAGRDETEVLDWQQALGDAVLEAEITIEARIGRLMLPLGQARSLEPGLVLPLTGARTDMISLQVSGTTALPTARLGQHRGQRAVKLNFDEVLLPEIGRLSEGKPPPPSVPAVPG